MRLGKAVVLSSFILTTGVITAHGYNLLRQQLQHIADLPSRAVKLQSDDFECSAPACSSHIRKLKQDLEEIHKKQTHAILAQ